MKLQKALAAALSASMLAAMLAGCGSGSGTAATTRRLVGTTCIPSTENSRPSTTQPEDASAVEEVLASLRDRAGVRIVG